MAAVAGLLLDRKLRHLALCRNDIGDGGAKLIVEAAMETGSLEMLLMSSCKMGEKGGQAMLGLVRKHKNLVQATVRENLMGGMKAQMIADKVTH